MRAFLAMDGVEVRVLGPLELRVGGEPVPIAGSKQRSVLAMLALQANQVVSVAALIDAVWGEPAPDRAEHTLQQHVSAVRKLLDPDREAAAALKALPPDVAVSDGIKLALRALAK